MLVVREVGGGCGEGGGEGGVGGGEGRDGEGGWVVVIVVAMMVRTHTRQAKRTVSAPRI